MRGSLAIVRSIPPNAEGLAHQLERDGWRSPIGLQEDDQDLARQDADLDFRTDLKAGPWYAFNAAANATQAMGQGYPSAAGTWASAVDGWFVPVGMRLRGGCLNNDGNCTAGTAQVLVTVTNQDGSTTTPYQPAEVEISTDTGPPDRRRRSGHLATFESSQQIEAGSVLTVSLVTAGYAPTGAEFRAEVWLTAEDM